MYNLTLVIPTKGRKTLVRCLESIMDFKQCGHKLDTLVVYDDFGPVPDDYFTKYDIINLCKLHNVRFVSYNAGYSDWGYPQIMFGYKQPGNNTFLFNIGDDDIILEGVISEILNIININGLRCFMFQAELFPSPHRGNTEPVTLWNDTNRSIERGLVTGQNLIVPNIPHLFGQMSDDFTFIRTTIDNWQGIVQWVPVVLSRCF